MSWRMGSSWSLVIVALALFPALACEDDDDDGGGLSSDADLADLFVAVMKGTYA